MHYPQLLHSRQVRSSAQSIVQRLCAEFAHDEETSRRHLRKNKRFLFASLNLTMICLYGVQYFAELNTSLVRSTCMRYGSNGIGGSL